MKSVEQLDTVTIYDAAGRPQLRPANRFYRQIAERQAVSQGREVPSPVWGPLIEIEGEPLSRTLIRERRGEFD